MEILDVDLLAFENGSADERAAVVDGVARSLVTGFVYVEHDLSVDLIDEAYGLLEAFFTLPQDRKDAYVVPGSNGQSGYTGLLVETAAIADVPDWKEMLNWGAPLEAVPSDDGTWVVVGSNFARERHPAWTGNLLAHPDCEILVRGTTMPATATLLEGEARDAAWQQALAHFGGWQAYTDITDREFRIFRLTPTEQAA